VFEKYVDAPSIESAKKKLIGSIVADPEGYEFEVEEDFILTVAPTKLYITPPYKLLPEEKVKRADWLRGAIVSDDEPVPDGATPVGGLKPAAKIPQDEIFWLIYEQEIRSACIRFREPYTLKWMEREKTYRPGDIECDLPWSEACKLCAIKFRVVKTPPRMPLIDPRGESLKEGEEVTYSMPEELEWARRQVDQGNLRQITEPIAEWLYPDVKVKVRYRKDFWTKFVEEAKRMARIGKIREAVLYMVETHPGITTRTIADLLGISYWIAYRAVKSWVSPQAAKELEKEAEGQATLERWLPINLEKIKKQPPAPKPKIVLGPMWLGQYTLIPVKMMKEDDYLRELKRILTLEGYPTLTPEEEAEYKRKIHEYVMKKERELLTYWLKSR